MQDSSVNHLCLSATLCIKRSIPFMEIADKGEILVQRYHGKLGLDMDMDKEEGATLRN